MKLLIAITAALAIAGCSPTSDTTTGSGNAPTTTSATAGDATASGGGAPVTPTSTTAEKPPVDRSPKIGEEVAVMETSMGRIVLMFFPDKAPNHVENFKKLATKGFYDGTKFHRVIPGFMIQGGDPNTKTDDKSTWGQGGPGYNVKAEFNDVHHARGILSMARTGDPDGAGSQFFIMVADTPSLDNQYSVFGQVLSGMDVADKIVNVPTENDRPVDPPVLKSVKIVKWPVK